MFFLNLLLNFNNKSTYSIIQLLIESVTSMETPLIRRKQSSKFFESTKMYSTLFNLNIRKKKFVEDEQDAPAKKIKLNDEFVTKQRPCQRQQSLTFIADFASTSTPTRADAQPITSTPNVSSHNPLKYHPTKTIRNKHKRSKPLFVKTDKKQSRLMKPLNLSAQLNYLNVEHSTPLALNCKQKAKKVASICKHLSKKQHHSTKINTLYSGLDKYKQSQLEISIGDLLYTPRKLTQTNSFLSSNAVKLSAKISTSTLVSTSKIYFL